jgi:hypothetical protein
MYNEDFKGYLSDKTGVNFKIINELFNKVPFNIFDVALALIERHGIDSEKLGKIWGDYLGFAYVNPNKSIVNHEYIEKMGISFIETNKLLPLYKLGKAVTCCTSNPTNPSIEFYIQKKLGELASLVFCFPFDIKTFIQKNKLK